MAFRFPGDLSDEQSFWQALKEGRDAVGQLGEERWAVDVLRHPKRSEPGRSITFSAGVLSRIDEFDANFFGISPREAAWLDPQQRLLLELAWEAMENGGYVPSRLAGSDCAVYVGISGLDYGIRGLDDLSSMTAHSMTGNTLSIAANRLSYVFDLHGPSVAVDTACSSSLVALHHACNSLRAGESSMALVGGVNLLLHCYPFIGFTKASMLSAHGRCRAFDASGDGYVRSEGGAVLLLKQLDQALAHGDDIQAIILGTGVNADGGRKTGITIPSSEGQAELMRAVLERSGLSPADVDYVEAHGTGTAVGDPIETAAIGDVYGRARPAEHPLPIGSVKTNLGHLEPASGMAGLIKSILALKHHGLPPSLHLSKPNPNIDFAALNLEVVTDYRPLAKAGQQPLVAGVNSFGFGGANAHVLLQEYCPKQASHRPNELWTPTLFLSARTSQALSEMAGRYAELLRSESDLSFYDVAYAAAFRRERLEKRLALKVTSSDDAAERLARFAQGESVEQLVLEDALSQQGGVAFIYSGNGAQWVGMGQRLMAESPRFADLLTSLEAPIQALAGFSILQELQARDTASRLDDTAIAQPLLFAIQVAITTMLREQGVEPAAVAGHSVGEVAAAWAAGALDLDQAIQVICARSAAQALTRGAGRMAAVGLSEAAMRDLLAAENNSDIEIAGINSPNNVTIAGSLQGLEALGRMLESQNIFFRLLDLDYAFHSRHMDAIQGGLESSLGTLRPHADVGVTFVSTVVGDRLDEAKLDAHYWWLNVRQPVRFAPAVAKLVEMGCRVFIEIGPHAILQRYLSECLSAAGVPGRVLPTLRRNDDGAARLDETVLRAHLLSDSARKEVFFPLPARHVRLPNYPWQRERHWLPRTSEGYGLIERARVHPLLGWRLKDSEASWENILDPMILPWLADHQVGGAIVLPGAAYVEMTLAAAREMFGGERFELEQLDILAPVVFDGEHARSLRFEFASRDGSFQIRSRQRLSYDEWTLHAAGRLLEPTAATPPSRPAPECLVEELFLDRETHYRLARAIGLEYGPAFQGLESVCVQGEILYGTLAEPADIKETAAQYFLHPALLDVCFQSLVDFFSADIEAGRGVPFLPVKVGRLSLYRRAPIARLRTHLVRRSPRSVLADFELEDAEGRIVARLVGCRFRAALLQRQSQVQPASWKIESRLCPHQAEQQTVSLPNNSDMARQVATELASAEAGLGREAYFKETLPLFEALSVSFIYGTFQELFVHRAAWLQRLLGNPAEVETVPVPFFRWLMSCLQQEGLLHEDAGVWRLEATDIPPAEEIWRTLLRDYPACLPELLQMGRIGRQLPKLLTGECDGRSFLGALRGSHLMETLYTDSPAYLGTRHATQQVLQDLARTWPAHRRLRVLEIASGLSEFPRQLAGLLPEDRLDYVLAQPDADARDRLGVEYQEYPFVTLATFAAEELELAAETPLPDAYDVIILRHSLHRARKPQAVLAAARRQLVCGGLLLLAERHPDLSADFVSGIDPLWWYETEANQPLSRLLPFQAWENALAELGFDEIETCQEPASENLLQGSYLLLAKKAHEQVRTVPDQPAASWLLLGDSSGPSSQLASQLRQHLELQGQRVALSLAGCNNDRLPAVDPQNPDSVAALLAAAQHQLGGLDHIVHLAGWNGLQDDNDPVAISACQELLSLVQAAAGSDGQCPRLWLVTSGGALACDQSADVKVDPSQAALWGFGRVIMNEYPALACTLIDVAYDPATPETAGRLTNELLQPDGENEIVLSAEARYGLRMVQDEAVSTATAEQGAPRFRLDFQVPGQLRNLLWLPQAERPLADDEIEVRPRAAGLNFRDIMYVMGLLPDEAVENGFAGASLGLEFSGVVSRVGAGVRNYVPGDAVMGFGSACFASHVVTKANAVTPKPAHWSFEAAATVPTVFFTVYYALKHLADLQPGERVLIHGAAGGVGIAAVQLARHLGAEIYATAGSEEKRDFVRLLGADHILDSRSLAFADDILALTGGQGVDVVLNSLAGEAIRRNLQVLKPFGRFLELGKRDFFENTPIGLRPFKDNISYFGIDADQLLIARPALAAKLFQEVMALFGEGILSPLPCRVFPAERVVDAFRSMQQARHIGKVVVTLDGAQIRINAPDTEVPGVRFKTDATYLITGGLSGFGLESARWLAEHGAGNLVLMGRRGLQTPGAAQAVKELEALGAYVKVVACDVADEGALKSALGEIQQGLPPLRGILHAAMVLDDALIANLDGERFSKVLAPKVLGAWHLHRLTRDVPLDHFILYSSVTTFIGNPGQANYVAANGALEGLAALRRSQGLPATCIGWGPIGDAGYLTRNETVKENLAARLGAAPLTTRSALAMLKRVSTGNVGTCAIADFEWQSLARLLPSAQGPRFAWLRSQAGQGGATTENTGDFQSLIAGKTAGEVTEIVRDLVLQEIAQILCIGVDSIAPGRSLHDLGMDSLMGVELALGLERRCGIQLPAMMLNEGPTVERVTVRIVEKVLGENPQEETGQHHLDVLVSTLAAQHGETLTAAEMANTAATVQQIVKPETSPVA